MSTDHKNHPYHYHVDKTFKHRVVDLGIPLLLVALYYFFYNFGKTTPSELIKSSGLLAIALLSLTLSIGPISGFFPALNFLKAHRKFWGILSFVFAFIHMGLIFNYYYKLSPLKFVDFSNPKYPGILAGVSALVILAVVTLTSTKLFIIKLPPKAWKAIQLTSYLALLLAVLHFYILESVNGVLVIKRLLGQITFGYATLTFLARIVILLLPKKE